MYPCLVPGDYVLFDRLAYRIDEPARGDVVVVYHTAEPQRPLIKRVVGLPEETATVRSGRVFVNGHELDEPYLPPHNPEDDSQEQTWRLGKDEYFLLGDARFMSTDSRTLGPFIRGFIKARAWLVYWPQARWRVIRSMR